MAKNSKPVSIRPQILGEAVTFLKQEDMACLATQDGLVELVSQLVYYREEGQSLYPEIYIFDDLDLIKKVLPSSQFYFIGEGERAKTTMLRALKKCAPLTEGGWSIYILRKEYSVEYGVFIAGTTIVSVSISETLIDNGIETVKAILIHQVAERIIEVKGVKADTLIISFGSQEDTSESPTENQNSFIDRIIENVEDGLKEPAKNFYRKLFLKVLQKGHGTLACIISSDKKELPKKLQDGIVLKSTVNIPKTIKDVLGDDNLEANSRLESQFSLIVGMMKSDGITVFKNNGEVAAYNVFVKHPEKIMKAKTDGGARSRTYLTLCEMIGNGIESAYIQSQDGKIEYK